MWSVTIVLKSNKYVSIDDLESINTKSVYDSSVSKLTKFEEFHLLKGERLTFVGKSTVMTLLSDDIEYVEINKKD